MFQLNALKSIYQSTWVLCGAKRLCKLWNKLVAEIPQPHCRFFLTDPLRWPHNRVYTEKQMGEKVIGTQCQWLCRDFSLFPGLRIAYTVKLVSCRRGLLKVNWIREVQGTSGRPHAATAPCWRRGLDRCRPVA